MKRTSKGLILILALMFIVSVLSVGLMACKKDEKDILVISREASSGTKDAFDELIKKDGASLKKNKNGKKYDKSIIVETSEVLQKTGDVIVKVSSTKTAIGYISLGSLNNDVKALSINGVAAKSENVLNGTYKLKRPFVVSTNKNVTLTDATADFMKYLKSKQAQIVIKKRFVEQTSEIEYTAPSIKLSGKVIVRGSTSMDVLMDNLIKDYKALGGENVADIEFDKETQGSSFGINAAKEDNNGNVIGMSSSALKDKDKVSLNDTTIALDAVVVIVNNSNELANVTIEQLFDIYTGKILKFSQLA